MPDPDGLVFKVSDLTNQLMYLETVSKRFLDTASAGKIQSAAEQLRYALKERSRARGEHRRFRWIVPKDEPIRTIQSTGDYQADGQGAHTVLGELSFVWEMEASSSQGYAVLVDNASISCTVTTVADRLVLAEWNFDIGDAQAPGTLFHVQQKLGADGLDVPRWHSLVVTPADALDFLLGELFQEEWPKTQSAKTTDTARFRSAQVGLTKALVCGVLSSIDQMSDRSALMSLKQWQPPRRIFVD